MTRFDPPMQRVVARCREGFSSPELPVDLVDLLRDVVAYDVACWGLLDPSTLWPTSNRTTFATRDLAARAWDLELNVPDVLKLSDLARGASSVGTLVAATDGEPSRSPRFDAVLGLMSATDELRAALTVNGIGLGWLVLFRCNGIPFSAPDTARVAAAVPHLATALCDAMLGVGASAGDLPGSPAVLVLDPEDRVESITPNGPELLDDLPVVGRGAVTGVIRSLAVSARTESRGALDRPSSTDAPPVRALMPGRSGRWLLLGAAPLIGRGDRVAVTIQTAPRNDLGPVLLRAYGLTDREVDVALAVLRGETTKEIAASLHLSPWTVQDHLKSVFDKTGVRSRRDLSVQLFPTPGPPSPG